MKKMLLGLAAIIVSAFLYTACNQDEPTMDYKYTYFTESINPLKLVSEDTIEGLPTINLDLRVVDELGPNIFVVEVYFYNKENVSFDLNAISLVIDYDTLVEFLSEVEINNKLYINEYEVIDSLGVTLYNNTGSDIRYAFATIIENVVTNEFILREIVKINGNTDIKFSLVPGSVEFANFNSEIYPLELQNIKFEKIQ